ncbi:glycoside hydrolase family 13 protein [Dendrothele bispora CBS 962.96]|uniref:Glycoside hydrolase family 13 protein n=1 Tax=Dendrothele bispora (strain CBS 962.96) TaxID=1314807 RepID=A0A4S8MFS4_DENBC|nr:glycoside hydrolase family 13 protein [Dendrothele bispora CBS 962.96]
MSSAIEEQDNTEHKAWWKTAIIYQIYPTSFYDSNGDGIGDLNGITSKLDYIKDLGVTVIWLSPIYKSPLADMGYDIADYRQIDPRYGTLEDWDRLLKGVHERGMKLMMDLVVNHTSDEHGWFISSSSSLTSPKRDWYFWRPPRTDNKTGLPNNWKSLFEGSVWQHDPNTAEYYLHLWDKKQPDLNWENPDVREAVWDIMKFWLDRGSDGFRMDVINVISKTPGLPDAPITEPGETYQSGSMYYANGPRVHEFLREMHSKVLSKYDTITVGETPFTHDPDVLAQYTLPSSNELHMVFPFELMHIDAPITNRELSSFEAKDQDGRVDAERFELMYRKWKLDEMKKIVEKWQLLKMKEGFWGGTYIENHDQARSVSRFGNDSVDELQVHSAKMLAVFHASQRGTLYVFQGQELGLKNAPRSWKIEDYPDVASQNWYKKVFEERRKTTGEDHPDMDDVMEGLHMKARDHARIPMSWDSSKHAGFTTGTPWMRVNNDHQTWNAAKQIGDENGVLSFWKKALKIRKENEVLVYGNFTLFAPTHQQLFAYTRKVSKGTTALAVMNFSKEDLMISVSKDLSPQLLQLELSCVLSNAGSEGELLKEDISLKPYDARLYISGP